jgi:hypothetical protein
MLDKLKQHWNRLALFGTALMTLFSGFVALPPSGSGDHWFQYARFLVALLTGLWFLPLNHFAARRHAWAWWTLGVVFVVASTVFFFQYNARLVQWSVPYWKDRQATIGLTLTPDASRFKQERASAGEHLNDVALLKTYGGDSSAVWNETEIIDRQHRLSVWYVLTLLTLASAVIAVSQAVYCAGSVQRRKQRSGSR